MLDIGVVIQPHRNRKDFEGEPVEALRGKLNQKSGSGSTVYSRQLPDQFSLSSSQFRLKTAQI